jgi:high affinity sulfate transporter 1
MTASAKSNGLKKYIPVLDWLPNYQPSWLRFDLLAGLTTAAVVIPQAMAYATIAGLPVEVGLYAALTPMVVYVLLGTSRVLSVSVTSTISMLTAAVLVTTVPGGDPAQVMVAAATLALLVGLLLILAGVLRFGFLANFISAPVLTGFKAGIGVVIFVGQIGKALGLSAPKGGVVETVVGTIRGLGDLNWPSLLIALVMLAILIVLPRLNRRFPAALVAVAVGIAAVALLNLDAAGVKLVGTIPSGLPSFQMPDLSLVSALWPGAVGIALMSFVESIAAARAFVDEDDPPVDADQELLALGFANVAGGLFQAFPGGGGTSQTAVNQQSGAKSQLAALATALTVALTLLFLAPLVSLIPQPTLAALVLAAAAGLIQVGEFQAIGRYRRAELIWALVTFAGVMFLGTLEGILVAVLLSLLTLVYDANHPRVYAIGRKPGTDIFRSVDDHPDDETFPGLLMVRTEGRMHFASAPRAGERLQELVQGADPQVVILECSAIPDFEYTALSMLTESEKKLRRFGITLWLAGLNPEPFQRIRRSPLGQTLGDERLFPNLRRAVSVYLERYDVRHENS